MVIFLHFSNDTYYSSARQDNVGFPFHFQKQLCLRNMTNALSFHNYIEKYWYVYLLHGRVCSDAGLCHHPTISKFLKPLSNRFLDTCFIQAAIRHSQTAEWQISQLYIETLVKS